MKILVVEDDGDLREIIGKSLQKERYIVENAANTREALTKVDSYEYDCVLLDIMLPDGNGLDILRYLHQTEHQPHVIIISAKDSIDDKVLGLDLGADDYLPKPFHLAELHARIKSVLRRSSTKRDSWIRYGNVSIDPQSLQVQVDGRELELSRKEADILAYFINRAERLIDKQMLAEAVWGDYIDMADSIDFIYAHMKNLRKKMRTAGADIEIKNVYGMGYKLVEL